MRRDAYLLAQVPSQQWHLTEQQVRADSGVGLLERATSKLSVFSGAGAKNCAKPESDVDLAITVGVGHYVALADKWEADLSKSLGLQVKR